MDSVNGRWRNDFSLYEGKLKPENNVYDQTGRITGYCFAIYGKSPQNTSDRDMAGKIALAIIRNLEEEE